MRAAVGCEGKNGAPGGRVVGSVEGGGGQCTEEVRKHDRGRAHGAQRGERAQRGGRMSAAEAEAQASAATPIKQRREVKAERRKIWDESESERILEAVKACGWREGLQRGEWRPDWTMISSIVKTRNAKQCRERWENFADPVSGAAARASQT